MDEKKEKKKWMKALFLLSKRPKSFMKLAKGLMKNSKGLSIIPTGTSTTPKGHYTFPTGLYKSNPSTMASTFATFF